jgi:peptide/nickel transport system substrate-binding protein
MRSNTRFRLFVMTAAALILVLALTGALSAQEDNPYLGALEGTIRITDPAEFPTAFSEAPMLAEMVAAGELPAVEERLPKDVLVLQPVDEIGEYGGTWRRAFIGPGDDECGNRVMASDKLVWYDYTGATIEPSVVKGWEVSEDGTITTLFLREGMKWSDGAPFTADDFVFWYEKLYSDERITSPMGEMAVNGEQGYLEKVNDYTVNFVFPASYPLFIQIMAGDTLIGGGQSHMQSGTRSYGGYAPGHYLGQFIPGDTSGKTEDELNAEAKDAGFEDWVTYLHYLKDWGLNADLPTIGPWHTVAGHTRSNDTWVVERNPYYWAVDTAGNQLPYIDRVVFTLAESATVVTFRAIAGELDNQERHTLLSELPAIIENQESGNYTLHIDTAINGSDAVFQINQSYNGDAEIAKWLTNADFRRALALGMDRDQLNETFWLGLGTPGSAIPGPVSPFNPGEDEYRNLWSVHDPDTANQMLDDLGLTEKDGDGFRVRTDNGERLRIEIQASNALLPWVQISEMVAEQWKDIGIWADVVDEERSLFMNRAANNESQISVWTNGGTEILYLFPRHAIPVDPTEGFMGPAFALWYVTGGEQGIEPTDPEMLRIYDLYDALASAPEDVVTSNIQEIWRILVEQQYGIATVGQSPALFGVRIVSNDLGNVPDRTCIAQHCRTPGGQQDVQLYFTNPDRRSE